MICKCGCGEEVEQKKSGRLRRYVNKTHQMRAYRRRKAGKENEVGKPSADPVVVGYSNHTPARSARQAPAKKTTRQSSATPLSLGRGFGGSAPDWYEQRWSQICFGYVPARLPL
jgi:hypothetical protein